MELLSQEKTDRLLAINSISHSYLTKTIAMKKILFVLLIISFGCAPKSGMFNDALCIENISTIDAENGLQEQMTVVIQENKIIRIAKTHELPLSDKNTIIDGTGKYLIPGLWDAHVHFAFIEEMAPSMFDLFLGYGVTSVRDTGGRIEFVKDWKDKAESDPKNAPRVMIAGPLIDGTPNVYDGSSPTFPPLSVHVADIAETEAMVEQLDSIGVDLLKAYEMLTPEKFKTITKMAREKGLKVTGHVPLSMDVISASNAGLNSIEHFRNLEMSVVSNWEELLAVRRELLKNKDQKTGGALRSSLHNLQRYDAIQRTDSLVLENVLNVLKENDTWQIPTLALYRLFAYRGFEKPEYRKNFNSLAVEIQEQWETAIIAMEGTPMNPNSQNFSNWAMGIMGEMLKKEIRFMAGTDAPIGFQVPGISLHQELALFVQAGMTPLQALESATLLPAIYFNMQDRLGLIQENMIADLLILDANPLEDIENTKKINAVIKDGHWMDRNHLDNLLKRK